MQAVVMSCSTDKKNQQRLDTIPEASLTTPCSTVLVKMYYTFSQRNYCAASGKRKRLQLRQMQHGPSGSRKTRILRCVSVSDPRKRLQDQQVGWLLVVWKSSLKYQGICLWKTMKTADKSVHIYTRWFKYDQDWLCVNKWQFVPVIFEPPCTWWHPALWRSLTEFRTSLSSAPRDTVSIVRPVAFQPVTTQCLLHDAPAFTSIFQNLNIFTTQCVYFVLRCGN
jgi:hypothetical protein